MCIQCYRYLNFDDGKVGDGHCDNLSDTARDKREREIEIEREVNNEIEAS